MASKILKNLEHAQAIDKPIESRGGERIALTDERIEAILQARLRAIELKTK